MLTELSLFTGYSGISLGVKLANINTRTIAYVEWEKYAQEIIKARIKDKQEGKFGLDDAPIFSDISSFRGDQFRGLVDLCTAGFPCQPHSVAGARRSSEDSRNKWPDTLRVIREVAPRYVLLENVPGLLSSSVDERSPAYGGVVVGQLTEIGYDCFWEVVGADDAGAPHRRKRWFCFGVLVDSKDSGHGHGYGEGSTADGETQGTGSFYRGDTKSDDRHTELVNPPGGRFQERESQGQPQGNTSQSGQPDNRELADSNSIEPATHTRDNGKECGVSETQCQSEHSSIISEREGTELADSEGRQSGEPTTRNWGEGAERGSTEDEGELGYTQHDGCATLSQFRGDEEASAEWGKEEQAKAGESQGTDRSADATGLRPGKSRSTELADSEHKRPVQSEPQGQPRQELLEGSGIAMENSNDTGNTTCQPGTNREWQAETQKQQRITWAEPTGSDKQLADSNGIRHEREKTDSELEGGERSSLSDITVADSDSQRGTRWQQSQRTYADDAGQPSETEGCHESELADCKGERLEGVGVNSHQEGWQESDGSVGLRSRTIPTWPPGPSESDEWGRILAEQPYLAPSLTKVALAHFRGMVDGRPYRVDQLKALGNGVVPAAVALFLRRLLG